MRWVPALALALAMAPDTARAEVEVLAVGGHIDVRATAAPLSEVLDRLAKATGMRIIHDGAPPRQPVTLALAGRTPAEAVLGVLDGQGLNYALRMDATGHRVETLILAGGVSASAGPPPAASTFRPILPPQPAPPADANAEANAEEEDATNEDEVEEPEPPQRPGLPRAPKEDRPETQPGSNPTPPQAPGLHLSGVNPPGPLFPTSPFAPVAPSLTPPASELSPPTAPAQDTPDANDQ